MTTTHATPNGSLVWVGRGAALQLARTQVWEAAPTDLPVLVLSEPGTGRQLAARTLHALSPRHDRPFVRVDCAALCPDQAEEILFGGVRPGALDQARGGTLFLDQVEALPQAWHQLLLQRLPSLSQAADPPADTTRLVAAASADLERAVRTETFCPELYYRLAIVPVRLPPLRHRSSDLPLLVTHFTRQAAACMGRLPPDLAPGTLQVLTDYPWPGNLWELKRLLERAVVLAPDRPVTAELLSRLLQAAPWRREQPLRPLSTRTTPTRCWANAN